MSDFIHELIEKTKSQAMSVSPQDLKIIPQPPLELPVPAGAQLIGLPVPGELTIPEIGLREAVEKRRSVRKYTEQALSLEELSYLLWMTQGVKEVTRRPATLRTVPSAGARHAFETYLLINRVDGLEAGLYRFVAGRHALCKLNCLPTIRDDVTQVCYNQGQVFTSAVTLMWGAVSERMTWRYVERGFRYLLLDAGHICQNLYLAAEAVGCGVCAIAAFDDDALNGLLGLDGTHGWVVYLGSLGKK
jgi:SagB-type dehydrogenase family enzyme